MGGVATANATTTPVDYDEQNVSDLADLAGTTNRRFRVLAWPLYGSLSLLLGPWIVLASRDYLGVTRISLSSVICNSNSIVTYTRKICVLAVCLAAYLLACAPPCWSEYIHLCSNHRRSPGQPINAFSYLSVQVIKVTGIREKRLTRYRRIGVLRNWSTCSGLVDA